MVTFSHPNRLNEEQTTPLMRNLSIFLSLLLLLALIPASVQAQHAGAKTALAARWLGANYQWPLDNGWDKDHFSYGMEVEYLRHLNRFLGVSVPLRLNKAQLPTNETGGFRDETTGSMDLRLHLKLLDRSAAIYPHIFAGISGVKEPHENLYAAFPVGAGLNFRIAQNTYLSTNASYRFSSRNLRDHIHLGGGIMILFGEAEEEVAKPADRDGDGVPDASDLCPDKPGLAVFYGCPDTDGDGIADGSDKCPTVAGKRELMGCPDRDNDGIADADDECPDEPGTPATKGCPVRDRDGDGIADTEDECPDVAGVRSARGCPDRDGDGVVDASDKCPDTAGPASAQGCPDRDADGVIDADDKCPNQAGLVSNFGCPEISKEDRDILNFALSAVQFETGNAVLKQESYAVLNQIVDILNRYPDYRCRINGHTDSIGESAANQTLSERRAKACYDYLVSKGVAAVRLSHQGYGESQPIADNRFMDGRAKNRRVEFDLYIP
jgi:outer membrane protein OmpA-like peptidoglycan-associated protein